MNRTDRLLAYVLELQSKGRRRAEDFAATFEVSRRTVYRDIQALCEAGVPVVTLPGQGYTLMAGYFLPPLKFTSDEATMLLLGSEFVAEHFDSQYKEAAQSAARKIAAVIPDAERAEVAYLQESIALVPLTRSEAETETLKKLRRAVIERRTVRFTYHTRYSEDGNSHRRAREADPYGLFHYVGSWYMVAHCHLRDALRDFRLHRISDLAVLDRSFRRPADFSMQPSAHDDQRRLLIRALFDKEIADWVREARSYYWEEAQDTADGLLVTLRVRTENEVINWLLGWGGRVRILEPAAVQQRLRREAEEILRRHKKSR